MTTITLANRGNAAFEVTGRKPLLDELRDQGAVSYTHLTLPTKA